MANDDIYNRISRLQNRRRGLSVGLESYDSILNESLSELSGLQKKSESWEQKTTSLTTKYVLGAMQEVAPEYTDICLRTSKRIEDQLYSTLCDQGIYTRYRLQGSVPLNVHIKGISDVDLLVINNEHVNWESWGPKASSYKPLKNSDVNILTALRVASIDVLKQKFPRVDVDASGSKSIKLTGGSLQRDVDVVPAHWVDTYSYQADSKEHERGVNILDSKLRTTFMNLPFKHNNLIKIACGTTKGSLRKSIRLCKTLKADLIAEGSDIYLSSYDLASIMYHANRNALSLGAQYELAILLETKRYFDYLYHNRETAKGLYTPDYTRKIFDSDQKFDSLTTMSICLDKLVNEVENDLKISRNKFESYFIS